MSDHAFCEHVTALNQAIPGEFIRITDSMLQSWRQSYLPPQDGADEKQKPTRPLRPSLDALCRAFHIAPAPGELMAPHETTLWKSAYGHPFQWEGQQGDAALETAIGAASDSGNTGPLVSELVQSSGIGSNRLEEALKVRQLWQWTKGACIEDMEKALQFLSLVHPQPGENGAQTLSSLNTRILSLITQREFDIGTLLESAQTHGNPGGALLSTLTGRKGLVTLSHKDLAAQLTDAGLPCKEEHIRKMRTTTRLIRGGQIPEAYAHAIINITEQAMKSLIERGISKAFTDEQKARCIDILTGIAHPKSLLQNAIGGTIPVGAMIEKIYERRGMTQSAFCEETGISTISSVVCGKSHLYRETASEIADWLGTHYAFDDNEKAQFTSLAMGIDVKRSPEVIMQDVQAGAISHWQGLRQIYDYSQLSRPALAVAAQVPEPVIQYSITQLSGGRIVADKDAIIRIGKACGISDARQLHLFAQLFDAARVDRGKARAFQSPSSSESDSTWQDRVHAESEGHGGWARGQSTTGDHG